MGTYLGVRETTFIYCLKDPRNGEIRYLGKSDNPQKRVSAHVSEVDTLPHTHKSRWISGLLSAGVSPELEILDEVPCTQWEFWEREYIRVFQVIGIRLTNGTDGGDGQSKGWSPSLETREKMRTAKTGTKLSPEGRKKVGDARRGKPLSPEHRAKLSASHKGVPLSPEHARNGGLARRGIKRRPDTLEKMSAAQKKAWARKKEEKYATRKDSI